MIKAHFPTLSYGFSSSLPPEINHKFSPQLPWRNCVWLQRPYQIIDRILLRSTVSGFVCFAGTDLCWFAVEFRFILPCHRNTAILLPSSVFIHTGLLSEGSAHLSLPVSAHCFSKLIAHSDKSCPEALQVRP